MRQLAFPRRYHGLMQPLRIGVLAVQGNFREHAAMLRRLGAEAVEVRKPEQLEGLDGLVIPGGESTTMSMLLATVGTTKDALRFSPASKGSVHILVTASRALLAWMVHIPGRPELSAIKRSRLSA